MYLSIYIIYIMPVKYKGILKIYKVTTKYYNI